MVHEDYGLRRIVGLEEAVIAAIRTPHPGHNMDKCPRWASSTSVFVRSFMLGTLRVEVVVSEKAAEHPGPFDGGIARE